MYFISQALGIGAWWLSLLQFPATRRHFIPWGADEADLLAFMAPDLLVAAPVSLAGGIALLRRSSWCQPLCWLRSTSKRHRAEGHRREALRGTEWSDFHGGHYWWIQSLFIAPEQRGTGLVERLIDLVDSEAEASGALDLRRHAHSSNARALHVYRRCGFDVAPYVIMRRDLRRGGKQQQPEAPPEAG